MVQSTATLTPASNGNHEEAHIAGGSDPGGRRPHEPPAAVIKNTLTAGADDDGRRLDRILRKARPALPISALHRLLRKGAVTVNGARARASDRVRSGDLIEFNAHEEGGAPPYARTASRATPPAGASPHAANSGANLQTQCNGTVAGNLHVEVRYPRKGGGLGEQSPRCAVPAPAGGPRAPQTPHSTNDPNQEKAANKHKAYRTGRSAAGRCKNLSVLFENEDVLIINKDSGDIVHGEGSLDEAVGRYLAGKIPPSLSFKPGPAHRLDRNTSGVILFSKSLSGAQYLSAGLREGLFRKTYVAIVHGSLGEGEAFWEDALQRDPDAQKTRVAGADARGAKPARTKITPLARTDALTLVQAEIETGRTHQIRAQAAAHGHPLLNDNKYNAVEAQNAAAFFLHSLNIEFPADNPLHLPEKIRAPLPTAFQNAVAQLFPAV